MGNSATHQNNSTTSIDWDMLVDDIDLCLHDFRFRRLEKIPTFRKRKVNALSNPLNKSRGIQEKNGDDSAPVVAYKTDLELAYLSLPKIEDHKSKHDVTVDRNQMMDNIEIGDNIFIKFGEKKTKANVVDIHDELPCAYVSFEDYPSLYDEYLTYSMLRLPNAGGINIEVPSDQVKAGLVVIALLGEKREEYRGVVKFITLQKMTRIVAKFSTQCHIDKWIPNEHILQTEKEMQKEKQRQIDMDKNGYLSTKDQWKLRAEQQFCEPLN